MIDSDVLQRHGLKPDEYDRKARELARLFADNFAKRFADVDESIRAAGPQVD